MSTCNHRLDLQILGSQPVVMPKSLPDHWSSEPVDLESGLTILLCSYVEV